MNIYLAADYARKHEMQGCRDVLEALGHKVVSNWIDNPDSTESAGVGGKTITSDNANEYVKYAVTDFNDIFKCDTLVQFTTGEQSRGGRQVELGIAMGLGKNIVIIGPMEHVFHTMPTIWHCYTWPGFIIKFSRGWND